jgi:hypothetical protein
MPPKRPSSKEESMQSLKEICHQFSSWELDSSGTSFTSSASTGSLLSTRKLWTGHERSPCRDSESSPESNSSCSYETESTTLSGKNERKGRKGKITEEWGNF